MQSVIAELFYGNIHPLETRFQRGSDYHKALEALIEKEENLLKLLDEPQKDLFLDYIKRHSELSVLQALESFSYGFKLGSLLSAEVFADFDEPLSNS